MIQNRADNPEMLVAAAGPKFERCPPRHDLRFLEFLGLNGSPSVFDPLGDGLLLANRAGSLMFDRGKVTIRKGLHRDFSGIGINPVNVVAEALQLPAGFREVLGLKAAFDLLAPHLDQGVVCSAGGLR